jgi:hypothetical protein
MVPLAPSMALKPVGVVADKTIIGIDASAIASGYSGSHCSASLGTFKLAVGLRVPLLT